jgi:hypothetical protein
MLGEATMIPYSPGCDIIFLPYLVEYTPLVLGCTPEEYAV